MGLFRTTQKPAAAKEGEAAPRTISLLASDNMHERARKIWLALGIAGDRFGSVPQIASILYAYRDLDEQARTKAPIKPTPE